MTPLAKTDGSRGVALLQTVLAAMAVRPQERPQGKPWPSAPALAPVYRRDSPLSHAEHERGRRANVRERRAVRREMAARSRRAQRGR